MIDIEDVLKIHKFLIDKFGGLHGVRDIDLLKSAIGRPLQTFDKRDLYKTPIEKSAAVIESIVNNHPFIDGNKRTGYVLLRLFLLEQGMDIRASQIEKYDFVIAIASGNLSFEEIVSWIKQHAFSL